jgi:phage shock protein PspC (stress-responsive transcriptional regulator)
LKYDYQRFQQFRIPKQKQGQKSQFDPHIETSQQGDGVAGVCGGAAKNFLEFSAQTAQKLKKAS